MHEPIKDSYGDPGVLGANRFDGGRWVDAYCDPSGSQWGGRGTFAFVLPAS
jgi:hypothetical protein